MKLEPVFLQGEHVRLEPLTPAHLAGLCEVGLDPELWRWTIAEILTPAETCALMLMAR